MRLIAACLLVASSSCALVPVQAAASVDWSCGGAARRPRPRVVLTASASGADGEDDPEVTKWARGEAAKSVVDAMYLKAAAMIKPPLKVRAAIYGYSLYALGFTLLLIKTLKAFPLIPPSPNSLLWCRGWLWTTIVDYYGAALALCGVILSSEPKLLVGAAWCAGCLFLGTPFCCLYVATRLIRRGTLRLADS